MDEDSERVQDKMSKSMPLMTSVRNEALKYLLPTRDGRCQVALTKIEVCPKVSVKRV